MAHAYHHYVGTVVFVTPRLVVLNDVVRVQNCRRGWTEFLADGFGTDTDYTWWPDGTIVPWGTLPLAPFPHDLPPRPRRRQ